jgi:D-amino-acid oxidase
MRKITVAGCGVIGLTTSIRLIEEGYEVIIVTKDLPRQTTSNKAAAFWFPYHIRDTEEILRWSMLSYKKFEALSMDESSGVHMIPVIKLGKAISEIEERIRETLPPDRFRPLHKDELRGNFTEGWHIDVPLVETPVYLPFLLNKFLSLGGKIVEREIQSFDELVNDDSITINCTGLGSRKLADDQQVIPVRGQIVFLKTINRHAIIMEDLSPTYIVYRTDGCICGGTYEENNFSEETEENAIQQILQRCFELDPNLKTATIADKWAGLRPYRKEIRIEKEKDRPLIHNYGHGGSGFTISWGCAEQVLRLVKENFE